MTPVEPTEAQVAAFKAAWEAEDDRPRGPGTSYTPGDRTRAGLRAALNVADARSLPTEPYTVIRADLRGEKADVFVLRDDLTGYETAWVSLSWTLDPEVAAERITAFEVLSEPRVTTAKAVLKRIYDEYVMDSSVYPTIDLVAREFGVVS